MPRRRAYERLTHEGRKLHPDERAAPAGRAAGARRPALQRDRASRRGREAVRRDGARACASAASRRRRSMPPTSTKGCCCSRTSAPRAWWRAIRRRRSRSAMRPPSTCWSSCTAQPVAGTLPVAPGVEHRLPPYDIEAFLIEAELLLDWYLPHRGGSVDASGALRVRRAVARGAARAPTTSPPTWVLRDYHSPNLLWLPEREGIAARRPARLPGRHDGARRPTISSRCCRTRASTCRTRWRSRCSAAT